jgi:predicted nucleic acid-binding protein
MREFVADAHPLVWHLTKDAHLSQRCRRIFAQADTGSITIWVPAIVLVEVIYLVEKRRLPEVLTGQMFALLEPPGVNYRLIGLDLAILRALRQVKREAVPDMPDRIIAATALSLGLPLLSRDRAMAAVEGLEVIW